MSRRQRGFTLIELIIVMVVTAIVALMITAIISRPLTSYFDTQRRADLAERAQSAINRMTIELEAPLPYSLRASASGRTLEFMPVLSAGRYRDSGAKQEYNLNVKKKESTFTSLTPLAADTDVGRIVINNTSSVSLYTDAVNNTISGVITPMTNILSISDCWIDDKNDTDCLDNGFGFPQESLLTLTNTHTFDSSGSGSPNKRFYIVKDAVTYHCDLATQTLTRYQGYPLSIVQTEVPATLATGTNTGLLASGVTECQFVVNPGSGTFRVPTVSILLTIAQADESATLIKEVQQWNAP